MIPDSYPLSQTRQILWYTAVAIELLFVTILLLSSVTKKFIPFISNESWTQIEEKKIFYIILSFLLTQQVIGIISNTGAFEVYCDDVLIFSKIQTEQYPSMEVLLRNLKEKGINLY